MIFSKLMKGGDDMEPQRSETQCIPSKESAFNLIESKIGELYKETQLLFEVESRIEETLQISRELKEGVENPRLEEGRLSKIANSLSERIEGLKRLKQNLEYIESKL